MIRGRVVGQVWGTRTHSMLRQATLLLVAAQDTTGAPTGEVIVARDTLDARRGETVLVAFGSGARNTMLPGADGNRHLLADAAVVQIVDGTDGTGGGMDADDTGAGGGSTDAGAEAGGGA